MPARGRSLLTDLNEAIFNVQIVTSNVGHVIIVENAVNIALMKLLGYIFVTFQL